MSVFHHYAFMPSRDGVDGADVAGERDDGDLFTRQAPARTRDRSTSRRPASSTSTAAWLPAEPGAGPGVNSRGAAAENDARALTTRRRG